MNTHLKKSYPPELIDFIHRHFLLRRKIEDGDIVSLSESLFLDLGQIHLAYLENLEPPDKPLPSPPLEPLDITQEPLPPALEHLKDDRQAARYMWAKYLWNAGFRGKTHEDQTTPFHMGLVSAYLTLFDEITGGNSV